MSCNSLNFQQLENLKDKGNQLFKSGDYSQSINIYSEIINQLRPDSNSQESIELTQLKLQAILNRSASYIKLNDFENGLADCNNALNIDNKSIKGLFRRATCLVNISSTSNINTLKNLDLAIEDLRKALYIEEENKQVKELLSKAILLKNEYSEQFQRNTLPSEILEYIRISIIPLNTLENPNLIKFKEFHNKWIEFYNHILSNGTHDIIINNGCCQNLIYIFEHFTFKSINIINSLNDSNNIKLYHDILLHSWRILSLLIEENDIIISDDDYLDMIINSASFQFNRINFNSNNKDLIKFRSLIRNNNNIINFTKIKELIYNLKSLIQDYQLKINPKHILNNIFNVLICIFDSKNERLSMNLHLNFLNCIINHYITIEINKDEQDFINALFLLILRNLSIIFQQRKLKGIKMEALDYNQNIQELINSLFELSYYSFKYLNQYNNMQKVIQGSEFILIIIFSLLSEKERNNNHNIDINSISNKYIISKYLINSIILSDNESSNWIVYDFINFNNGLMGLKVLHYSNREILKGHLLNYPQILHCILLIVLTNFSEYNSILNYSKKELSNSYYFNENLFNTIIKPSCIEILSLIMEYKEIRKSIVKDDDTVILIYNICKNIIQNNNNNMDEFDSCCRLLNGISKTTMENNDILDLFINQLDILSLLEYIWNIFKKNDNKFWSCIQNSFEIFTILSMHKDFKIKLLNYKIKNSNDLFIIKLLNLPEAYNLHNDNEIFQKNTFLYLYISFIQNLLTSNYSDPYSESKIQDINENDEFKSIYFLKRQRFYNQYNTENNFDFDQSQMEQLEMMYKQLPEYTRNERNGHYDRGDEILVNTFRKLIIEKSKIMNFMYIILEKNILNSNDKNISSSLPLILNISNNIVDLIVNTENLNEKNSKEILLHRGKIIQNGGLKCLLDSITIIDNELLNNKTNKSSSNNIFSINTKYLIDRSREYKQAISKLLIYISPTLISYKLLVECAIKIQSLLEDDHELLQYESALAITNILSKSFDKTSQDSENDSISIRIYNNGLGWSLFKNLCFTDNNHLRAAGLEGLCNFCNKDYVVSNHFISSKSKGIEDLKMFIAFSHEDDKRIQIASLGALAMLSSYSDVSKIILDNWNDIGTKLIDLSQDYNIISNKSLEIKERILFCLNNLSLYISSQNHNKSLGDFNNINTLNINENQEFPNIYKTIQDCMMLLE
ncbi:hypothetical protein OIY81_844 [Cryptosporidium canis]|nr:hypothetical protein OIY81_844 [Cryptosporidium canis]